MLLPSPLNKVLRNNIAWFNRECVEALVSKNEAQATWMQKKAAFSVEKNENMKNRTTLSNLRINSSQDFVTKQPFPKLRGHFSLSFVDQSLQGSYQNGSRSLQKQTKFPHKDKNGNKDKNDAGLSTSQKHVTPLQLEQL